MLQMKAKASITLPELPYMENALEPVISARTISIHYGKHHAGYVDKLNDLIAGTPFDGRPLAEIVVRAAEDPKSTAIFHNAAQTWNHTFYWHSMRAKGGGEPAGKLKSAIERDFGEVAKFREAFSKAAAGEFGSGWTWLVAGKDGKLKIVATDNADTPLAYGETPLLTIDLWEHAYYLDYQNRRADYVAAWLDKLVDWSFAERNSGLAVTAPARRAASLPRRDFRALPAHLLDVPLHRENRILFTLYGHGVAGVRDDVHLHVAPVQIGDELHCDGTKSDLCGRSVHRRSPAVREPRSAILPFLTKAREMPRIGRRSRRCRSEPQSAERPRPSLRPSSAKNSPAVRAAPTLLSSNEALRLTDVAYEVTVRPPVASAV